MASKDRDWFRNKNWNAEVAASFDAKLKRARDKQQYLRIQASYLAGGQPEVALALLDRYFALGDHFDMAAAFVDQSTAHLARRDTDAALHSLQRALARERERPNLQTQARCAYADLVVSEPRPDLFDDVLAVLDEKQGDITFPVDKFVWHAVRAIIYDVRGVPAARQAAVSALRLAEVTSSGFDRHPTSGWWALGTTRCSLGSRRSSAVSHRLVVRTRSRTQRRALAARPARARARPNSCTLKDHEDALATVASRTHAA